MISGLTVTVECPDNITVKPKKIEPFNLEPDESLDFEIQLTANDSIPDVGGFISVILTDSIGQRKIAAVAVNRKPDLPLPVEIETPDSVTVDGENVALDINVINKLEQKIEGMIELIMPFESWRLIDRNFVRQKLILESKGESKISFPLKNSGAVKPGSYFGVIKIHAFEEQAYSKSCSIIVPDRSGILKPSNRKSVFGMTDFQIPDGPKTLFPKVESELKISDSIETWRKLLRESEAELKFIDRNFNFSSERLALKICLGYDNSSIYFMTELPWKFRQNPYRKRNIRLGDCLQIVFYPPRVVELGCALTSDGVYPWTWNVVLDSPYPPAANFDIEIHDNRTLIEAIIPWSLLRLEKPPDILPWNLVIHVSNNNNEWTGAWVLSDGTVGRKTKDGHEFGLLVGDG